MALRGAAMLGARLAPKVLKILGKTAGSAIAGTAVDRVAKKIFGGGRARRRLRRMLQHRRRTRGRGRHRRRRRRHHRRRGRGRVRGRGLFTSLLGPSAIRWMGGKPVRNKRHRNPVHRLKSWATSKAKSWIAKKVRKHLGVGGGRGRAYGGRGLRLFSAPGLVRRKTFNFQTAARKRKAGTGSTSRGGCRYHKRRHHRRRRR